MHFYPRFADDGFTVKTGIQPEYLRCSGGILQYPSLPLTRTKDTHAYRAVNAAPRGFDPANTFSLPLTLQEEGEHIARQYCRLADLATLVEYHLDEDLTSSKTTHSMSALGLEPPTRRLVYARKRRRKN